MLAIAQLIVGASSTPNGTVFAISATLALTARHCVYDGDKPLAPLLAVLPNGPRLRLSLLDADERADVALLLLEDRLPSEWDPIGIVDPTECRFQSKFRVSGYPSQRLFEDADTLDGHIVSTTAKAFGGTSVISLYSPQVAAPVPRDPHGFSGAPVLISLGSGETEVAVGLVRWSEIDPITGLVRAGTVLAAPLAPLSARWLQIAQAVITAPSLVLLEPRVPEHFRDRDSEVTQAVALISKGRWCGFYGLSGTGKTSAAARVARQIRTTDRNRVIWLTVGEQTDISVVQEGLANALGHSLRMLTDQAQRVARLRAITSNVRRLIVFDDVRSPNHLDSLLSSIGYGNSVLVTAQQEYPLLSARFSIAPIIISALPPNDGALLLLDLLNVDDAADQIGKWEALATALGNHPLAIEVAAGDLRLEGVRDPLQYIEARVATGKWATGEPTLQRLEKTVLNSLEKTEKSYGSKFRALAAFEGRAVSRDAIGGVCSFKSDDALGAFIKELLLRGLLRRVNGDLFTLHPFISNIARLGATQREKNARSESRIKHINHYFSLLERFGGYEWNLREYPRLVSEESEIFHAIAVLADMATSNEKNETLVATFIDMVTLISWYLHWRGYWDLRIGLCRRATDMAEGVVRRSPFSDRQIQIGNLYVDRGWVHLEQGDVGEARNCAASGEKWLLGSGDQIFAHELRAEVLCRAGKYDDACKIFDELLNKVLPASRAWFVFSYRLSDALAAMGKRERSTQIIEELTHSLSAPKLSHNEIIEDVKGRIQYRAGLGYLSNGDEGTAFTLLKDALNSFAVSEIVAPERVAASIEFAALQAKRNLHEDCRETLQEARGIARRTGDSALLSRCEKLLAQCIENT